MRWGTCFLCLLSVGCLSEESAGPLDWSAFVGADAAYEAAADGAVPSVLDAAVPTSDASVPSALDAGGEDARAQPNPFEAAPPFVSQPVVPSAKQQMAGTGNVPTKTACLACHNGKQAAPAWLAGGTVFRDVAGSQPAADSEVRIVDTSSGRAFSVHSDADGNFWLPMPSEAVAGPFWIAVRNGEVERLMPLLQRGLDCNGSACHGGAQGPIHLP